MNKQGGRKGKKRAKADYCEGIDNVQQNSVFGRYSVGEMIAQLKGLALDPCLERDNIQPLTNQILKLRKIMLLKDSETPWRKRKLEQFIKDKLTDPSALILPNQQSIAKLSRRQLSHASSLSCFLDSVNSTQSLDKKLIFDSHTSSTSSTFDYTLPEKDASTNSSFLNDTINLNHPHKDTSPTVYSNESANVPKLLTHRRSPRLQNFNGDHVQKNVVPVGPRFQVDVPEWINPLNRNILIGAYKSDSDNSKWLGSKVWPIEIGKYTKNNERTIGKGSPNSCKCVSKGSNECIKLHIHEERLRLKCDLGHVFFTWKFDEMGEQVSELWSLNERKTFESLVKTKQSANGKSFLKRALKCFPDKSGKDIVNYYFNVHVPQRMSWQTRSLLIEQVDTDNEDEVESFKYMGFQKRSKGKKNLAICNAKDAKARYLRGV